MNTYTHICPEGHTHSFEPGFCADCGARLVREPKLEHESQSVSDSPEPPVEPTPNIGDMLLHLKRNLKGDKTNPDADDVLPADERERGWKIVGDPHSTTAFYQWPVAMTTPDGEVRGVFRRFKTGALTTKPCYEKALELSSRSDATLRLYSYGTTSLGGGARTDYEITGLPEGQSLRSWFKHREPGVECALYLAPLLIGLLKRLQDLDLRPIVLNPDTLWLKTEANPG
ncbi:MAG: hypothetical protein ACRD82_16505, partial [Blastocatellia bacterium]